MKGKETLVQLLDQYLNFQVAGKRVPIPYIRSRRPWQFWRTSGKGTPEAIRLELERIARRQAFDLEQSSPEEIRKFMQKNKIGIECSGLVYHLLDAFVRVEVGQPLRKFVKRFPGVLGEIEKWVLSPQRYRRINARTLTSGLNSVATRGIGEIRVGDMIRMSIDDPGDHVLLVVGVEREEGSIKQITYVHSSGKHTRKRGPHLGTIKVVDPELGLEKQEWEEELEDGGSYSRYFRPQMGDGVVRLKILNV